MRIGTEEWRAAGHQESDSRMTCRFCGFAVPSLTARIFDWPPGQGHLVPCLFANEITWQRYLKLEKEWLREWDAKLRGRNEGFSARPIICWNNDTGRSYVGVMSFDPGKDVMPSFRS